MALLKQLFNEINKIACDLKFIGHGHLRHVVGIFFLSVSNGIAPTNDLVTSFLLSDRLSHSSKRIHIFDYASGKFHVLWIIWICFTNRRLILPHRNAQCKELEGGTTAWASLLPSRKSLLSTVKYISPLNMGELKHKPSSDAEKYPSPNCRKSIKPNHIGVKRYTPIVFLKRWISAHKYRQSSP